MTPHPGQFPASRLGHLASREGLRTGQSRLDAVEGDQPITPDGSALDAFLCAGRNEGHTTMTEELGAWLVNEIVATD